MTNNKKDTDIFNSYVEISKMKIENFLINYNVNNSGIDSINAEKMLKKFGLNEIKQSKPKKWYNYFFESLFTPFNLILLGIVAILSYTDIYLAEVPSYANIIVIIILVIVSTLLDFFEEYSSNKAAEKLKQLVETTTTVIRDNEKIQIPIKNIVKGDIVILSAGSMIPADLRIIEAKDLYVRQSALTGESDSVRKNIEVEKEKINSIIDLENICFMGTNVISGSAKGIVIKTGDETYFGKIAHSIKSNKEKTAFQKGIESISKLLIKFMLILIPIVFILNVEKHDIITAFTFAVAIAICITPLLLPVILSSSLSKGAIRMSKKKTIVKKLDSIQNFGAMNILCTDKTGTLTEDKIVLEKYLDIYGKEDISILKQTFLNSYFQTGLKGNIDEAIIKRALENNLAYLTEKYKKIDEIPFDFSRRRLSVVVENENKKTLITKGAVEEIINISTKYCQNGEYFPLTKEIKDNIRKIVRDLNNEGLRVVAVCIKNNINNIEKFTIANENDMALIGFVGFLDPPKESAKISIEKMNNAGIRVIVLTGDNFEVTKCICTKVGINSKNVLEGAKLDKLSDMAVLRLLKNTNIFVKLSPIQKARIVRLLKQDGNIVGYMGDGINDSPSLTNSDVGISVDTAVDIAKESADIILLEKDLEVLLDGVTEGRRTHINLMKYIKLATSFNFGEVVSVIIASICLPFLPETPIQLLVEGLIYDFGQLTLPFDNVDEEHLKNPKKFDIKSLKNFILFMGPLSSIFDLVIFISLWFFLKIRDVAHFQTIWFTYSIVSNLVGMHIIRTEKIPFIKSNASKPVYISSVLLIFVGILVPFTSLGKTIGFIPLAFDYIILIFLITFAYCIVAILAKKIYIKKYNEWL